MEAITQFGSFALSAGRMLWAFLLSNWLMESVLFASLILPKLVYLIKKTFGK